MTTAKLTRDQLKVRQMKAKRALEMCIRDRQKAAQKPGHHRIKQHRKAVLIHASGQAQNSDGRQPGAGKGADAQGQADLPVTGKIAAYRPVVPQTALSDEQQGNGIDAEINEV